MNTNWDAEADLLVVGFGGAGAAAALKAAELGASVILLEKQPSSMHTPSTRMSGGIVMGASDADAATEYLDRCAGGMIPRGVSRAWAEKAMSVVAWLDELGTDLHLRRIGGAEHPMFPGAEAIDVYMQSLPRVGSAAAQAGATSTTGQAAAGLQSVDPASIRTGQEFFAALAAAVSRRPRIKVEFESPAQRLIRDDDGTVVGVEVRANTSRHRLHGRKGVVLTTGGYEFDDALKMNHLKAWPIHFYGNPGNTGDGVRMAMDVGADIWHMNQMIGRAIGHFELPDGTPWNFLISLSPPGYLITDKHGRRFANEFSQAQMKHGFYYELLAYDSEARDHPRIPCFWFFDQRRMAAGPLTSFYAGAVAVGYYDWSEDNSKELAQGWIKTGSTVTEAAAAAGVTDPDAVAAAILRYNEGCARGLDEFGRPPESLVPLDQPPYYCVPLYPGGSNTCGGPRRDAKARILDTFGQVIPGLYGAGELGEAVGLLYPADGSNLSESQCFGQIAAETALEG